jgi:hypothetical protein
VNRAIHSCRFQPGRAAPLALVLTLLSGIGLVFATRDGPGIAGYVSESGVPGAPHALLYRITLLLLACAAAAAALALRPVAALAALALGLAVPGLLVSGAVPCSTGCPLPPYEHATTADLVHAGASIAATGLCALAMLAAATWCSDRWVRLASRVAVAVTVPAGTAMLAGLLLSGRTVLTGVLERVLLAACLGWVAAVSALRAFRDGERARRDGERGASRVGSRTIRRSRWGRDAGSDGGTGRRAGRGPGR